MYYKRIIINVHVLQTHYYQRTCITKALLLTYMYYKRISINVHVLQTH